MDSMYVRLKASGNQRKEMEQPGTLSADAGGPRPGAGTIERVCLPGGGWADVETRPTVRDAAAIERMLRRTPGVDEAAVSVLIRAWSLDVEPGPEAFRNLRPELAEPILEFFVEKVAHRLEAIDVCREASELFAAMKRRAPLPPGYDEARLVHETGWPWTVLQEQPWDVTRRLLIYRKALAAAAPAPLDE